MTNDSVFQMGDIDTPGTSVRPMYIDEGRTDLVVTSVRMRDSHNPQRPRGTKSFVFEGTVLASTNPGTVPGTTRAWVRTFTTVAPTEMDRRDFQSVKACVYAILGTDPGDARAVAELEQKIAGQGGISALLAQVCGEANPLAGKRVRAECWCTRTKSGGTFTRVTWVPLAVAAPEAAR